MSAILRRTLLVFSALLLLVGVHDAAAQIELDTDGNVGISTSADSYDKLHVSSNGADAIYGYSTNDSYAYGVHGTAYGDNGSYGVYGYSYGGTNYNYGVRGYTGSASDNGSTNYGVYGHAYGGNTAYAGYFSGDVSITGTLSTGSDRKLKENLRPLGGGVSTNSTGESVLQKVLKLRPSAYQFKQDGAYSHMNLPEGTHFGLVAQDVEALFPELVSTAVHPGEEELDDDGSVISTGEPTEYKSVNYTELIPVLIQALQEQQAEIDQLKKQLDRR